MLSHRFSVGGLGQTFPSVSCLRLFIFLKISVLNYLYFSNFYSIRWHTFYILHCACHLNIVQVFQVNSWHPPLGSREQSCDLSRWHTMSRVDSCQFESPSVPCAASRWDSPDMLKLPGNCQSPGMLFTIPNYCIEIHSVLSSMQNSIIQTLCQ